MTKMPKGECVGQRAIVEDRDWKLFTQMLNWSVAAPRQITWRTRTCRRTKARQRLDYARVEQGRHEAQRLRPDRCRLGAGSHSGPRFHAGEVGAEGVESCTKNNASSGPHHRDSLVRAG